ncbi:MAG: hypothetical protein GY847_09180 [Proteobacteria bacterium]|nr:hypothetical protein [Pseudomonadota bacterium]
MTGATGAYMVACLALLVAFAIGLPIAVANEDTPASASPTDAEAERELPQPGQEAEEVDAGPCAKMKWMQRDGCVLKFQGSFCVCVPANDGVPADDAAPPTHDEISAEKCADVTCSGHGQCEFSFGAISCDCDWGYEPDPADELACVPSGGFARQAAIGGLVAAPVATVLGSVAGGRHAVVSLCKPGGEESEQQWAHSHGQIFGLASLVLVGAMGPVVSLGGLSARDAPGVSGSTPALISGGALWAGSIALSIVWLASYSLHSAPKPWMPQLSGGLGGLSLLLLSIDALVAYENALELRLGEPLDKPAEPRRIWTWIAFGLGGAAAVGAAITGSMAIEANKELEELDEFEASCQEDPVDEQYLCTFCKKAQKAKRLAGGTDILIGTAAAGLVMGTALFFLEPRSSSSRFPTKVSLAPFAVPGGAGFVLGGSF